ncbi:MAG: PKD domain-containing protein [Bacteroidales bacterium]|nr:PKD domain-containing protein [Bacteroidales bacterium]
MTKILQIVIRFSVVLLAVCFFTVSASAQLEFSNWIVGVNTVMHIEPDGKTHLFTHNGIGGDKYHYHFRQLLSKKDGTLNIKIGTKFYRYDNGILISDGDVCSINYINSEPIFEDDPNESVTIPFLLNSPDNKYSYVLYNTFSHEYKFDDDNDLIIRISKTQIRCFCINNYDNTDKGNNFVVHEYTHKESFKGALPQGYDPFVCRPFFAGLSHTNGKSIWVITKSNYEDSIVAINLDGSKIISKKKSYLPIGVDDIWMNNHYNASYNITDNGKIYSKVPNKPKTLCITIDQDNGFISDWSFYDYKVANQRAQISATGKYLYHTPTISSNTKKTELVRYRISDLEKGITNPEVINPTQQKSDDLFTKMCIGIDGNIYVHNGQSIMVVYDSETDNPRFETLYTDTDIPDSDIHFPNYLYTYDLFACNSDCDRNATFSFPDPRNEIIAYEWDFGDGFKSTEITPTHQYATSGNYTVTLEVTLKNGSHKILPTRKIIIFDQKPSAKFDNAQVCDSEPLKIILNGNAPYEIFYTFNDENKSITTSDNEYLMDNITGRYQITKVTDQFCEYEPTQNNNAEILPKLNKLTITTNND